MPSLSMSQVARLAANVGHGNLEVRQSRRGWAGICKCGFNSHRVPTKELAEQLLTDHIVRAAEGVVRRLRASGRDPLALLAELESRTAS